MAADRRWRTRHRFGAVLLFLLQVVQGYEESYTISQLSPKSAITDKVNEDAVLQTSRSENVAFRIEPSVSFDDIEAIPPENIDAEEENHVIVARSANPNDRESRSINVEDIPAANNNEIDNELEVHNKRKYYEIHPTKSIDYLRDRGDDMVMSSDVNSGFGDRFEFRFPGEVRRVPKARALKSTGPQIRPSAVQPTYATASYKDQGRQNTEIQNIITGIVKLLNGNVNVQANTQLLRPGRPMASRINNRGPPRISDVPPLPDLERPVTPIHSFVPTKTPPPYPFERPQHSQHHGIGLPEQIVPPVTPHRPGFHRPIPPWQRPRPTRPPSRRPNPGLPIYKPTPQPLPIDIPDLDSEPEIEVTVSENETSHSENNIHLDDKETVPVINLPEANTTDIEELTDVTTTTTSTTTEVTTTEEATEKTTEKATEKTTEKQETTTDKPKPEKPEIKTESNKKKDTFAEKDKLSKDKYKIVEDKLNKTVKHDSVVEIIQSSIVDDVIDSVVVNPTPTDGLISHAPTIGGFSSSSSTLSSSSSVAIESSSINSEPLPPSQSAPYQPYRPRPGIVLDDTDFKPHGTRRHPALSAIQPHGHGGHPAGHGVHPAGHGVQPHGHGSRRQPSVITAHPPGYGEIFDVTVSVVQGGPSADVHIENVNIGHGEHDDIIVSASGDQGFVSIDGKRTYLNLFDSSTVGEVAVRPSKVVPQIQQSAPAHLPSIGHGVGTGIAIPADDILQPQLHKPPAHGSVRPAHGAVGPTHGSSQGTAGPSHAPVGPPGSGIGHRPPGYNRRPQPTVRIDTCIVGDDSTCDAAQNEKCRTEAGISSCGCRAGYGRRVSRDPCRRTAALLLDLRVDRLYDKKVSWDAKLADKDSELYQQLSFEAVRAIDSAFSMTPFSDDFMSSVVNRIHRGDKHDHGVFINYTVMLQETPETVRSSIGSDIQKHILGVIRRRSNNIGASALFVDSPHGAVLPLLDLDECSSPELNDCHKLASCTNTWGGFRCACPESTKDASQGDVSRLGRQCVACPSSHCNERGTCSYVNNQPYCSCSSGYYGSTCGVDGEVVGVGVGASLAALLVIAATLAALLSWSRKWSREQKAAGLGSPVFSYMAANTIKSPPVSQPPYQVTLEERMRWAQIAEAMAQASHYAQPEQQAMPTRPSSAMFGGYPTLPPVPMPRMGMHGHHTGTLNTVASRANTVSHHNMYGYTNHMACESTSSEASSHVQERADLLVPRPKSRARSMHNQTGIYYDVEYENAPEAIYGTKGIPLSTYTISRGPPFYK